MISDNQIARMLYDGKCANQLCTWTPVALDPNDFNSPLCKGILFQKIGQGIARPLTLREIRQWQDYSVGSYRAGEQRFETRTNSANSARQTRNADNHRRPSHTLLFLIPLRCARAHYVLMSGFLF